ncbi:MAG: hypothetical protein QXT31_03430 [Candidatus Bathyarchaeia archaeon]
MNKIMVYKNNVGFDLVGAADYAEKDAINALHMSFILGYKLGGKYLFSFYYSNYCKYEKGEKLGEVETDMKNGGKVAYEIIKMIESL